VILWGNGTFTTPALYDGLLRHLASHGLIVAAAESGLLHGTPAAAAASE